VITNDITQIDLPRADVGLIAIKVVGEIEASLSSPTNATWFATSSCSKSSRRTRLHQWKRGAAGRGRASRSA
jgi:hypothetical protein